nr:MAG TPA: hypothetical protein [Caudoviricetes sp.]
MINKSGHTTGKSIDWINKAPHRTRRRMRQCSFRCDENK